MSSVGLLQYSGPTALVLNSVRSSMHMPYENCFAKTVAGLMFSRNSFKYAFLKLTTNFKHTTPALSQN